MYFEILLKDDPLRVSSVSMFRRIVKTKYHLKILLVNYLLFLKYSPAEIAIFLKDSLLLKTFPLGFSQFLKQRCPVK